MIKTIPLKTFKQFQIGDFVYDSMYKPHPGSLQSPDRYKYKITEIDRIADSIRLETTDGVRPSSWFRAKRFVTLEITKLGHPRTKIFQNPLDKQAK